MGYYRYQEVLKELLDPEGFMPKYPVLVLRAAKLPDICIPYDLLNDGRFRGILFIVGVLDNPWESLDRGDLSWTMPNS
jgi:hypothetical protein